MFTDEDKQQLKSLVADAMDEYREKRQLLARANPEVQEKQTRLYLITLTGHQIAFPDEDGRAVLNQVFYANVELTKKDPHFYGGQVEVIAYGDGRLLAEPRGVLLASGAVVAMAEVPAGFLTESGRITKREVSS